MLDYALLIRPIGLSRLLAPYGLDGSLHNRRLALGLLISHHARIGFFGVVGARNPSLGDE